MSIIIPKRKDMEEMIETSMHYGTPCAYSIETLLLLDILEALKKLTRAIEEGKK